MKGPCSSRISRSNHVELGNKHVLVCSLINQPYLPETLSHESWISRIQRLPHLRKFKEGARQRPGRPPGPSETAFRICPFQTMELDSFLGTKESMEAPISKFTPTNRHDKFHRKDDSVSLKGPRKIRARTVGSVFCYHRVHLLPSEKRSAVICSRHRHFSKDENGIFGNWNWS